jgi:type II secretory pathway component PulM
LITLLLQLVVVQVTDKMLGGVMQVVVQEVLYQELPHWLQAVMR